MFTVNALARLVESATWFDSLSEFQKKEYVKEHPNSKYAKGWTPTKGEEDEDVELESDEFEPVKVETLGSKIRGFLVKSLGGEPNRVFKNKAGYLSKVYFGDDPDNQREVTLKYSGHMLKKGLKFSPYGYWKDKDTYVYLTKAEWKGLTDGQRRSAEDRARTYGIGAEDKGDSVAQRKGRFGKDAK